jgi:nucleoporin NUP82
MAILTSHTCHVCILPASSHLHSQDTSPLRLKTFQLGPTAHVLEQSPLVSAIWHPLSASGDCLVTITQDACVRLWELDSDSRSSFDQPALAIDLKKLANATSTQADFSASKYGTNKGFSPDDVEMQVAAACFGGQGSEDEHGWASMTLWVAMSEGDVYAMCPFLPSRWMAPATLLPSLSTSVVENSRAIAGDADASESERRIVDQQRKWLAEVDGQDPVLHQGQGDFDTVETFYRPTSLSAVPKLQGPFQLAPEPDFGEITDIHVIAPKIDDNALYEDADEDQEADEGLSMGIVCLATSTNEVHVCLDVDGVEAEWLPNRRSRAYAFDDVDDLKELLLFETIDLAQTDADDDGWPTFTASPIDRYDLFTTHSGGVCTLSFRPWVGPLEDELSSPSDSGAGFRIDVVLDSAHTLVEQPVELSSNVDSERTCTAIAIADPVLGYFVLTAANNTPYTTVLDIPSSSHPFEPDDHHAPLALTAPEPRAPYRPAPEFEQPSALPQLIKNANDKKLLGNDLKSQVRFSPATLQLLTEAHRIMSNETHRLGVAAADLFRQCERMRSELREQVRKVAELAQRIDDVTGNDDADYADNNAAEEERLVGREKIESRIDGVQNRAMVLNEKYDSIRKKMLKLGGEELSAKEKLFGVEVAKMERSVQPARLEGEENSPRVDAGGPMSLASRFDAVLALQKDITKQASDAAEDAKKQGAVDGKASGDGRPGSAVGSGYRKQKLTQVMAMLERETALVEAVMERLARLQKM